MSQAPFVSTSAAGPVVNVNHACARHPELRGDRGCNSCSNALCTACARSLPHRHCPDCRQQAGKAAHVIDASWRVQLLIDALTSSFAAIPRRLPALVGILAVSLLAPLSLYLLGGASDDDGAVTIGIIATVFGLGAFTLGPWLQPLMLLPTIERTSKGRVLVGALLGGFVAFAPLFGLALLGIPLEMAFDSPDLVGQLLGLGFLSVGSFSLPLGLVCQGRAVLGQGPGVRGTVGAVVAHFCVAGVWATLLTTVCVPLMVVVGLGVLVDPVVAGVAAVVSGVLVWLLLGMGSFAAGSARYSVDLERLS